VTHCHSRNADPQILTTAQVQLADLLGVFGVYDDTDRLPEFAIGDHYVHTALPDDHPARNYHTFIENIWDRLVGLCSWNHIDDDSAPPMPSLTRQDTGIWEIGFLLQLCRDGVWSDDDEFDTRFLCGMINSYPGARWRITTANDTGWLTPRHVWQRLGLQPQNLVATVRNPHRTPAQDDSPWGPPPF
jgi:hypothetical protein